MRENRVKRVMRAGGLALVSHVGFADPSVVELIPGMSMCGPRTRKSY